MRLLQRQEFLLQSEQRCQHYYFVLNGALRVVWSGPQEETTGWVAFERELFTDLASYKRRRPSAYAIEALEN